MYFQQNQQIEMGGDEDQIESSVSVSQLAQNLEESRKFTLCFIAELKEKALTPISQEVLDYYHAHIKQNYSVKDILNIIDKRISKMIRNKKIKQNWNIDDIILLLWFVSKYIAINQGLECQKLVGFYINKTKQDWQFISKLIPGSGSKGCMFKFISLKKVKLSLFNWSQQEEIMLRQLVRKLGQNKWKQISQYLYEHNPTFKIYRTPKQCRQHWNCYLDPKLKKGPWSETEDLKLLQNVRQNKGERKWSSIKYLFEGRTENALKNRYNLLLERQKKINPNLNQKQLLTEYIKEKGLASLKLESLPNSLSKGQQEFLKKMPDQIFEEAIQDSKNKILTETSIQGQKSPQIFMKSQRSSFKLSQAFKKCKLSEQNSEKEQPNYQGEAFKNCMFIGLLGIPSIMAKEQGFYTNFVYKSYYGS